jgi:hypothetical protein
MLDLHPDVLAAGAVLQAEEIMKLLLEDERKKIQAQLAQMKQELCEAHATQHLALRRDVEASCTALSARVESARIEFLQSAKWMNQSMRKDLQNTSETYNQDLRKDLHTLQEMQQRCEAQVKDLQRECRSLADRPPPQEASVRTSVIAPLIYDLEKMKDDVANYRSEQVGICSQLQMVTRILTQEHKRMMKELLPEVATTCEVAQTGTADVNVMHESYLGRMVSCPPSCREANTPKPVLSDDLKNSIRHLIEKVDKTLTKPLGTESLPNLLTDHPQHNGYDQQQEELCLKFVRTAQRTNSPSPRLEIGGVKSAVPSPVPTVQCAVPASQTSLCPTGPVKRRFSSRSFRSPPQAQSGHFQKALSDNGIPPARTSIPTSPRMLALT